ncbi:MAG TPA: hypothetical protein VGO52_14505 [Hyphomonadaceae bacterium]|jgi:hypothetical protein|nr:hypothetical protein [Hyphomonadaceae bacterium]
MTAWPRKSDAGDLDNLARKARRRGDAAQAVLWYRAMHIRQQADQRCYATNQLRWKFHHSVQKLQRMEEELERLRRYVAWHPQQIERAKAAEAAQAAQAAEPASS